MAGPNLGTAPPEDMGEPEWENERMCNKAFERNRYVSMTVCENAFEKCVFFANLEQEWEYDSM